LLGYGIILRRRDLALQYRESLNRLNEDSAIAAGSGIDASPACTRTGNCRVRHAKQAVQVRQVEDDFGGNT
jgi:hypothetical protein